MVWTIHSYNNSLPLGPIQGLGNLLFKRSWHAIDDEYLNRIMLLSVIYDLNEREIKSEAENFYSTKKLWALIRLRFYFYEVGNV